VCILAKIRCKFLLFFCFFVFFFLFFLPRFHVSRQSMLRGTNDVMNVCRDGDDVIFSHFARLDERLVMRLEREPKGLKNALPDRKVRKVKIVKGMSKQEEERQLAEEDRKRSKSLLEKQKERKQRQTSSAALDKGFLEEGLNGPEEEYEKDFVEEDEGGVGRKRGRDAVVQEDSILRAKRGATPSSKAKKEVDDGIQLYDDEDDEDLASFIDDDDEDEGGAKGVIGSSED
jgi:hypothetical protein